MAQRDTRRHADQRGRREADRHGVDRRQSQPWQTAEQHQAVQPEQGKTGTRPGKCDVQHRENAGGEAFPQAPQPSQPECRTSRRQIR